MDIEHSFPHVEQSLAGTLGISRVSLRNLRSHLVEGEDWVLKKKRVRLSASGVDKVRQLLALPPALPVLASYQVLTSSDVVDSEKIAPVANAAQAESLKEVVTLHVWQRVKNARILEAFLPGTDPQHRKNIVRVRVRDSKNFVRAVNEKPMELKARHLGADLYELATACPRFKGRW